MPRHYSLTDYELSDQIPDTATIEPNGSPFSDNEYQITNLGIEVDETADGTVEFRATIQGNALIPYGHPIDAGDKLTDMEQEGIREWFVVEAENRLSTQELANNYDNGIRGLARAVLEDASSGITEQISMGVPPVAAFNDVAQSWPTEPRVLLASHEANERDRENEEYVTELEKIANNSMMDGEQWQTTLDGPFGPNPFDNDDLSRQDAITAIIIAEQGFEADEELLTEIQNHENFREALRDLGDPELALHYHLFDSRVPNDVIAEAAPPNEWPDDTPVDDVRAAQCEFCGDTIYEIHTDDGRAWFRGDGTNRNGVMDVQNHDDFYFHERPATDDSVLCGNCFDQWDARAVTYTLIRGDHPIKIRKQSNVIRDIGGENCIDFSECDGTDRRYFGDIFGPNVDRMGHMVINPNSQIGNVDPQRNALRELAESPDALDITEPVAIREHPAGDISVIVFESNAGPAIEVKEHMEAAV